MTNSRNKGAGGEREVASLLFAELGIKFERDLEQYRKEDRGDLIANTDDFPFLIEVKRYAKGWTCKPAWESQAFKAAKACNKQPCVIYRFDRQDWRVRLYLDAFGWTSTQWIETDIQGFAEIAREIMAGTALKQRWAS